MILFPIASNLIEVTNYLGWGGRRGDLLARGLAICSTGTE